MCFFCTRIPPREPHGPYSSWCLSSSVTLPQTLFLMILTVFRSAGQVSYRMPLSGRKVRFVWSFLTIRVEFWAVERKTTEFKCCFQHIRRGTHAIYMTYCWCWPWSPGRSGVCEASLLHCYPFPFLHPAPFDREWLCGSLHLRRGVMVHLLEVGVFM